MRRSRRTHADRTIWRQLEDAYVWVFGVVLVGVMAGSAARHLNLQVATCESGGCGVVAGRLWPILLLLLVATALRTLLAIGPVVASNASGFWLLASPVDRAALLRPAYLAVLGGGVAVAVVGAVVGMALPGLWSLGSIGLGLLFLVAVLWVVAGAAVLGQVDDRRGRWMLRFADVVLVLAGVLILLLGSDVRDAGAPAHIPSLDGHLLGPALAAAFGAAVLVVAGARVLRRLGVARVVAGGDLVAGLAGAAASLDVGLLADVVATRRWRSVSRVRFGSGRFAGAPAIVQREARRVLRWPRRLVFGAALLILPYAAAGSRSLDLVLLTAATACLLATRPLVEGLRTVSRSPGLNRTLPLSPRGIKIAYAVVPGVFAVLWCAAAIPAFASESDLGRGLIQAGVVAAAVTAGVVRHGSAPRPSYDGPLLATPAGAVPPGLMSQPLRGLDVAVIALLPALLNAPAALALAVAVAVLALVLSVRGAGT
jgi:Family of unknown function (DUF6297)